MHTKNRPLRAGQCFSEEELDQAVSSNSNPIRILVADDHPLFRNGIAAVLAHQPDMSLVAEASNGREAIQQFRVHRRDNRVPTDKPVLITGATGKQGGAVIRHMAPKRWKLRALVQGEHSRQRAPPSQSRSNESVFG